MSVQPGDVVVDRNGKRAVVDGSHFGIDLEDGQGPRVLAVFNASAFRGRDRTFLGALEDSISGASKRDGESVSCSGGPGPLVPIFGLVNAGETEQRFWRWLDRPRAGGGVDYMATVALWTWDGEA